MTEDEIRERLRGIDDPCSIAHGRATDIVRFGLVDAVEAGDPPRVRLRLSEPTCFYSVYFMRRVKDVLGGDAVVEFAPADALWEGEQKGPLAPRPSRGEPHGGSEEG